MALVLIKPKFIPIARQYARDTLTIDKRDTDNRQIVRQYTFCTDCQYYTNAKHQNLFYSFFHLSVINIKKNQFLSL